LGVLQAYDSIVYDGGLYISGIIGVSLIKKNLAKLNGKKIVVFAVGASSSKQETTIEIMNKNLTTEQLSQIKFFYLRGGFNLNKLGFVDRQLMKLLKSSVRKKKELTEADKGMLKTFDESVDFTQKENIKELVEYVLKK